MESQAAIHSNQGQPVRMFPIPGTNLARILSDGEYRQAFHRRLKQYNPLIVALYRAGLLPLFGAGRTVMLLTTRGRKSGKRRSTPIGYFRIGGEIYLFSAWGRASSWFKNLLACPEDVSIQIGLRRQPVRAQVVAEPAEIRELLARLVSESPAQARTLFGWEPGRDCLERADFSEVIARVLIVRFERKSERNRHESILDLFEHPAGSPFGASLCGRCRPSGWA